MTQSPPKASVSSRPPPAQASADAGRRITALAAGGAVLLLSGTAVALWPRTYGTEAKFTVDGNGANLPDPMQLASRIEAALLEREELTTAAMDLPPELRSPDPIGRLRAGIRVQSRGGRDFAVEFRGSDPDSVQRITNRLVDRAVVGVPKVVAAATAKDQKPDLDLIAKTRAVTEFLTTHPEVTVDPPQQAAGKPSPAAPATDRGLEALRYEKRTIEQHLATPGSTDNPYAEPRQDPALLSLRLAEIKTTIARREAALKQPRNAGPQISPELAAQWRTLLADLAVAQSHSLGGAPPPEVTAHVTARATLPTTPLTPNRLILSIVAALLTLAAAMVAYVLPRKPEPAPRSVRAPQPVAAGNNPPPRPLSDPPPAAVTHGNARRTGNTPAPPGPAPIPRSDPPPPGPGGSEPPGPIAAQRTVVLTGNSSPPQASEARRSQTDPGGMQAPPAEAALAATALAPARASQAPAPLFGSRPAPGAGSYSVSSSHPPPMDGGSGPRTTVERLSPLQSARPPSAGSFAARRSSPPQADAPPATQPIVSRPPALDPEAERWAARFETVPPPEDPAAPPAAVVPAAAATPTVEEAPRKKGRWKTQVMGSMVPLEVSLAREERAPLSEEAPSRPLSEPPPLVVAAQAAAQAPTPSASTLIQHDVPTGWRLPIDIETPEIVALRDAVLAHQASRRVCIVTTGASGARRAQVAAALAFSLTQRGARVLLAEGDFDGPELHQVLDISPPPGSGFSQQLGARRQGGQLRPWTVVRCAPQLHVLVEGRMRSPGMLASGEFERAMLELREQHDVVVVHAPPQERGSDLPTLRGLAQAVLVTPAKGPPTLEFGDAGLRQLG